jgi:hypothetical protein
MAPAHLLAYEWRSGPTTRSLGCQHVHRARVTRCWGPVVSSLLPTWAATNRRLPWVPAQIGILLADQTRDAWAYKIHSRHALSQKTKSIAANRAPPRQGWGSGWSWWGRGDLPPRWKMAYNLAWALTIDLGDSLGLGERVVNQRSRGTKQGSSNWSPSLQSAMGPPSVMNQPWSHVTRGDNLPFLLHLVLPIV